MMPFKETSAMQEKFHFIIEWESREYNFSELCDSFGISRTLGYKYLNRYKEKGIDGLKELSRAPNNVWNRTPSQISDALLALRRQHPRTGAKKLLRVLERDLSVKHLPAVSTANLLLKKAGLVQKRRHRRRIEPIHPIFDPNEPNEIWSADFKGQFRMGDCRYCYPLTICDSCSRRLFAAEGMYHPSYEGSKPVFIDVFREWGLPEQMHTDSGPPFGCAQSLARLTHLSVWFIDLGILPVYSDPGHPEQNGRHERMHRELKAEATKPPAYNLASQQRKLNNFVREYNEWRPHEALDLKTPAEVHVHSPREYPEKIESWEYPKGMRAVYVCRNGAMRWAGQHWITVSSTLIERCIGLEEFSDGLHRVYYRDVLLGYFNERTLRITDGQGRFRRRNKKV
jgi:transposase InsO family protein